MLDLSSVSNGKLKSIAVGPDGRLFFVILETDWRAIAVEQGITVVDMTFAREGFEPDFIQPLPGGDLLIVSGRSNRPSKNGQENNGRIYSANGDLLTTFLLGDGIADVQATTDGVIWTSFFDEGVYGNDSIGHSGLIARDMQGNKTFEFQPAATTAGLPPIDDCYAMNVVSNTSLYAYYYSNFPLVHIRNRRIEESWTMPVAGSSAFAVSGRRALFRGGYKDHHCFYLYELGQNGKVIELSAWLPADEDENPIAAERVIGRGNALYLLKGSILYRWEVDACVLQGK